MGSVIAPIIGAQQAESDRQAAQAAQQRALGLFQNIQAPSLADQQLNFQNYQNAGDFQNQAEANIGMGPTAMAGIQADPRLVNAQMAALQQLTQTGQMGMTPAEQAALHDAQRQASAMAQAKQAQILDNAARTGMGGSGASLAAQLLNAQSGADRASQNSNQIAQQAQQQALQAITQSGNLAGQINAQQFGQQSDIAKAKDYINQFNTQNAQNVQQRNIANANAAALRNLNNKQNIGQQNTQLANQQQQANKGLYQQQFNNQMARAGGMAGQYNGIAQTNQQNAARTANMYAGIGQGIDTAAGGLYNTFGKSGSKPNSGTAKSAPSQQGDPWSADDLNDSAWTD